MEDKTLNGHKILIVEDDLSSRLYLNKVLEKTGAVLLNAVTGREAVDIAVSEPDLDIVLMDIQLPVFDGYVATKMIREVKKDLIIIAQTAYGLHGDMEKFLSCGFNDYLIKPIMAQLLRDKLVALINGNPINKPIW
jgi:CheY-like chemotaxis protein